MKKTWIKIYEICPECTGTGRIEADGLIIKEIPCIYCIDGKISRLIETDKLRVNNLEKIIK